ncbi:hypothetical protein NAEGRDRAFT_57638 [Naegleria gruberi]|uniref:Uncharacterized protein n=1 Tax=Naegleria gruberi TaxID=5762 RepID=D2VAL9_NAEGR|nr:uncharacterized protein NAEGRDRAFT_57638 [Naegleria gruberi]EFC46099.1 hypothetical protein NAEGRDRAFT_57638 [Naegleria gruberi]|eukprot:XP_002678843.1 hypothetical protein NAEGRDRAFT_57638 [Naegleria gruberi strain NEG-M]
MLKKVVRAVPSTTRQQTLARTSVIVVGNHHHNCSCCACASSSRSFSTSTLQQNEKQPSQEIDIRSSNRVQDILNSGQFSVIVPPVSIPEEGFDFNSLTAEKLQDIRENQRIKKAIFHIPAEGEGRLALEERSKGLAASDLSPEENEYMEEIQKEQEKARSLLKNMMEKEGVDENLKSSIQAIFNVEQKLKKQSGQQRTLKVLKEAKLKGVEDIKSVVSQINNEQATVSNHTARGEILGGGEAMKSIYDPGYNLEDRWKNIRSRYSEEEYKRSATFSELLKYFVAFSIASFVCLGLAVPGFKKYIIGIDKSKAALKE